LGGKRSNTRQGGEEVGQSKKGLRPKAQGQQERGRGSKKKKGGGLDEGILLAKLNQGVEKSGKKKVTIKGDITIGGRI